MSPIVTTEVVEPEVQAEPSHLPEVTAPATVVDLEAEILAGTEEDQQIGKEPPKQSDADRQFLQTQALIDVASAVKTLVAGQQATRQVPYNEALPVTPFNPSGDRNRTKLKYTFLQHGHDVSPLQLRESEIILINKLKPGRYIGRKVEVQLTRDGTTINVTWANAKIEQRIAFYQQFPDIQSLLTAIVKERAEKEAKRKAGIVDDNEEL